jgi:MFS superfamily sulfate permease-like transporter
VSGQAGTTNRIAEYLPAVGWLRAYRRPRLRGDLAAGVTTAAVVIPQAMAYATIAGLPVQTGLYVATVPMLAYALLGTSRPLSESTTSTLSALTAAAVAGAAQGDPSRAPMAAVTLAALSGGCCCWPGCCGSGSWPTSSRRRVAALCAALGPGSADRGRPRDPARRRGRPGRPGRGPGR